MSKPCPLYGKAIYADCLECDNKVCKPRDFKYDTVIIALDQSYKNTGVTIYADKQKKKLKSIRLEKLKDNAERRKKLKTTLGNILNSVYPKAKKVVCLIERIRLCSRGFINIDYIKSIGALNAVIVDTCREYDVPVYSVDTRCWKAQVIGTSKPLANKFGVPPENRPTVRWVIKNGWENDILNEITTRKQKGTFIRDGVKYQYNDDAADSAGIGMFWWVGDHEKLKLEN